VVGIAEDSLRETRSYGQSRRKLGNPNAFRAVAHACATNPVALVNPCHRVIAADGKTERFINGESNEKPSFLNSRKREFKMTKDATNRHVSGRQYLPPSIGSGSRATCTKNGYALVPSVLPREICEQFIADYGNQSIYRKNGGYGASPFRARRI